MLPHTRHRLAGPPFVLPRPFDAVAEAWWRARPRSRVIAAVVAVGLTLLAGVTHAASTPDGPPTTVWVAARDLLPGDVIGSGDVQRQTWPSGFVPAGASVDPAGTVTASLPRGAVVTDRHLGERGIVAMLPEGRVAVAVPLEQLPALTPGTWLDLVGPGSDGGGQRLAQRATVIADDGAALWIAIDPEESLGVSAAVASGTLAAVVVPG